MPLPFLPLYPKTPHIYDNNINSHRCSTRVKAAARRSSSSVLRRCSTSRPISRAYSPSSRRSSGRSTRCPRTWTSSRTTNCLSRESKRSWNPTKTSGYIFYNKDDIVRDAGAVREGVWGFYHRVDIPRLGVYFIIEASNFAGTYVRR